MIRFIYISRAPGTGLDPESWSLTIKTDEMTNPPYGKVEKFDTAIEALRAAAKVAKAESAAQSPPESAPAQRPEA